MFARRLISLPLLVFGGAFALLLGPVVIGIAAVVDALTGLRRRRFLRLAAIGYSYLLYELVGVAAAVTVWVASGFGLATRRVRAQRAFVRLQRWWAAGIFGAVARFGGAQLEVEGAERGGAGPVVILGHHICFADALLPTLIFGVGGDLRLHHVLKDELAWDPCLDLVGHWQPNVFVNRVTPGRATAEIEAMGAALDVGVGAVIFPEGTFFSPRRRERAIARLARTDPDLAERAQRLHFTLPPHPGGALALLAGAPDADVVLYAHTGFRPFSSFAGIIANLPFSEPVTVKLWRYRRDQLPSESDEVVRWLFDRWKDMDEWIEWHERG